MHTTLRFSFFLAFGGLSSSEAAEKPNIILMVVDDLGYGDVSCYGAKSVKTPQVDRLAAGGQRFTQAHTTSATCTPSRYALFTGEYPWRKRGTGILPGDAGLIIEPERGTLPQMLQKAGYTTGAVGKWHLGLGPMKGGADWNAQIKPGAAEVGFTESFLMAATGDRVPCVYVRNDRVQGLDVADPIIVSYGKPISGEPTGKTHPELLKMHPSHGHDQAIINGISRIGHMKGGTAALWKDEDMADVFVKECVDFITKHQASPFFLYFGTQDIHVPRVPHPRFAGKSGMGPRGDALLQMDWCLGQLLDTLDKLKLAEKTIVILTSDNGPVVDDGYKDDAVAKLGSHKPSGGLRGGKYSLFEAGTRVPFILQWSGRVKPGVSDALISQVDVYATLAALTGGAAPQCSDGENVLAALLGESATGREVIIEHAQNPQTLAIRDAQWKLIERGNGAKRNSSTDTELGNDPQFQLYDLKADPAETTNVAAAHPERVEALRARLATIREKGRQIK